jgi:hypothetical protein
MPVLNLALPPQPAVLVDGGAMGVEGVDPNAGVGVGVEVLVAPVPPPQAASVVNNIAAHTCLISFPCFSQELDAR